MAELRPGKGDQVHMNHQLHSGVPESRKNQLWGFFLSASYHLSIYQGLIDNKVVSSDYVFNIVHKKSTG